MKKFITKIILFSLIGFVIFESISLLYLWSDRYLQYYPGNETYFAIEKSKTKNKAKILLLGDSVGGQLFPNNQQFDNINSLATNQAISMAGQYFLLKNYLSVGNTIDKLVMLFAPDTFKNNLNQVYTYHYFLKPFYNSNYFPLYTSTVYKQIEKIPYHQFVYLPHIKIRSWAPDFKPSDPVITSPLSPISAEYLSKIKNLSIQHNFELIILPTPVSIKRQEELKGVNIDGFSKYNFSQELEYYFTNIIYLDDSEFIDGIHLFHPESYRKSIIPQIIN